MPPESFAPHNLVTTQHGKLGYLQLKTMLMSDLTFSVNSVSAFVPVALMIIFDLEQSALLIH